MSLPERNWDEVEAQVRRVVSECAEPFDRATVTNASDVIALMRDEFSVPDVFQGYWPTIRFCWGADWEIEVFSDRIEIYLFHPQPTDIQHYPHVPGDPFSAELRARLAAQRERSV